MQRCPEPGCARLNQPSARFCEKCGRPLRKLPWTPLYSGHTLHGGAYRILEPLGKGGMGALYLAADTGAFDRPCVVKELLDYYDPTDPDAAHAAQRRFETEARLLAQLSHPALPRIYRYFSEAGRHYIVMEYIEGETLERAVTHTDPMGRSVAARPLSVEEVLRHALRVCRLLEYLAERPRPVIHHDIKPANLIVEQISGEARLVDLGTAEARRQWATQTRLDPGGATLFGTEGYAPPEQYQGRSVPRSDVYALAATVYHLLTDDDPGEHPFHFPQLAALPGPLGEALARALHLEVQRRSTATEFQQALETWLIPEDRSQPFVFRSGAVAHTTGELAALSDQHWAEARRHLASGDFDRWFRQRNRHDLVDKAKSSRLVEPDADAALETFLRRLDPRLPPPRLAVEPPALDFGRVSRDKRASRRLTLRNEGRGYAGATFSASAPWLSLEPAQVGCLAGKEASLRVQVEAAALPLRRDHQAIITCTPRRGAPLSIPVAARLSLLGEGLRRTAAGLRPWAALLARGARQGFSLWLRTFRSLLRSRIGVWVVLVETLALAGVLVALWASLRPSPTGPDLVGLVVVFLQALSLALLVVFLLPALVFVVGGALWEAIHTLAGCVWGR